MKASEHIVVDMHEPGRASLDTNIALALTKAITSVKPASRAVEAITRRPKALELRAKSVE